MPPIIRAIGGDDATSGLDALTDIIREEARGEIGEFQVTVPLNEARAISLIESRGQVLEREYSTTHVTLKARIGKRQLAMLRSAGATLSLSDLQGNEVALATPPNQPPGKIRWGVTNTTEATE